MNVTGTGLYGGGNGPYDSAKANFYYHIGQLAGTYGTGDVNKMADAYAANPYGVSYQELQSLFGKGASAATAAPAGGSGGGASTFVDKSNDINLQRAGLAAADQQVGAGLAGVDKALGGITGQYDAEKQANEGQYTTQSNTNQSNLQRNKESSLLNAAQGRRGLFGTLASLGALGGSGIELANRAVQQGANKDLGAAADTYGGNQSALDTSIGTFRTEDQARRQQAQQAADDARSNVRNQASKAKQGFYKNLSDDYSAMGNAPAANDFANLAATEYGNIASTSVPSSNLAYSAAPFTAPTLANYLLGANNTQVATSPTTPGQSGIPGLVADNRKKLQPA